MLQKTGSWETMALSSFFLRDNSHLEGTAERAFTCCQNTLKILKTKKPLPLIVIWVFHVRKIIQSIFVSLFIFPHSHGLFMQLMKQRHLCWIEVLLKECISNKKR